MIPRILDCTLRDGGYYNAWDFGKETVDEYVKAANALPAAAFCAQVALPIGIITVVSGGVTAYARARVNGAAGFVVSCVVSALCTGGLVYLVGLRASERRALRDFARRRFRGSAARGLPPSM